MELAPDMQCENEFCCHHVTNTPGGVSDWNKTKCSLYEIDPYDPKERTEEGLEGIRIDTCPARIKFVKMWAEEQKWIKKKAG